jgi:energy-coupling factor transporter ATP-binding protein EcfA2
MKLRLPLHLAILATVTASTCQGFQFNDAPRTSSLVTDHKRKISRIEDHRAHPQYQHKATAAVVQFEQVFHQHSSNNWARQLFSSEPIRTWALENVTFCWEAELVLLVGASMSGKSTALQLMRTAAPAASPPPPPREEQQPPSKPMVVQQRPTRGSVHVSTPPIYLDATKLAVARNKDDWTVRERLAPRPRLLPALALTECADKTLSQLSVSEQYKLAIAELCMNNAVLVRNDDDESSEEALLPAAPILLLDEWLDKEPTSIVHAIEDALEIFVAATQAVVCVVTHQRDRWKTLNRWELRQGKVVSIGQRQKR